MSTARKPRKSAIEKTARNAVQQGEKVWLAGLGVLAKAQEEGRDVLETDREELFNDLVKAGRKFAKRAKGTGGGTFDEARRVIGESLDKVRDRALDSYDRVLDQAGNGMDKVAEGLRFDQVFDRRVEKALKRLGYPTPRQYNTLKRKVMVLETPKAPKRKVKAKAAPKKTAVKKTAVKKPVITEKAA
jgi:poly(hydroxyalkanoate) granule-associated protein